MPEAYIVSARRTAGGRRNGRLAGWHPADLGAAVLDALVADAEVDPAAIDDVIIGCVSQVGEQCFAFARNVVLASSLPQSVPGVTIDRQCGSSQQALHFAAQAVMSGMQDLVVAGGVESMTRVPMGSAITLAQAGGINADPFSPAIKERFGVPAFNQFAGAQLIADKYGFTREDHDAFALESHRRAAAATQNGAFAKEIVPIAYEAEDGTSGIHETDEGIRADSTMESLAQVKLIGGKGTLSAATASQICDGASGVLVASAEAVKAHGLTPIARVVNMAVTAGDPVIMLEEPIPATRSVLQRAGLSLGDIDLFEVNEAFASIPLAWAKALGADLAKVNIHGGAIALGHPLGATGTKLMTTLIHALRARSKRYGLQTMCESGGIANATLIEAL
ncbi:acetyl-CoA C-acetyltransferase [Novosphingobium sp. PY1]|uniref:acetyl-CoA C-acetyltransferase n=1 Tax=Novosphingobium sp. PY1 TaxID=1882221 RepID=UPI001A8EA8A7|nr:acetyl-CoA C-acetyltransferase [Novosphingobium sp. PY1]GFM31041.1 acetyl-CoA acetyltransferase [Novosphingobium sp. PY1]